MQTIEIQYIIIQLVDTLLDLFLIHDSVHDYMLKNALFSTFTKKEKLLISIEIKSLFILFVVSQGQLYIFLNLLYSYLQLLLKAISQ